MKKLGIAPARNAAAPDTAAPAWTTPNSSTNVSWLHAVETTVPAANRVKTLTTRNRPIRCNTAPSSQTPRHKHPPPRAATPRPLATPDMGTYRGYDDPNNPDMSPYRARVSGWDGLRGRYGLRRPCCGDHGVGGR